MIEEQQPDGETRATTMEDDNYFDSYEDIEVRSTFFYSFFFKISPSCCVFNQCKISILVADKTPEILTQPDGQHYTANSSQHVHY
jgi:hypothetical protein